MTPQELFEANSYFHETLAACSGNRFLQQTVRRLERLRRLVEYRQASARAPRKGQAEEHLAILESRQLARCHGEHQGASYRGAHGTSRRRTD